MHFRKWNTTQAQAYPLDGRSLTSNALTVVRWATPDLHGLADGLKRFARHVADRVVFMADGQIVEKNSPAELFGNPQEERTRQFLSQIIRH